MYLVQVTFRSRDRITREYADMWIAQIVRAWSDGGQILSHHDVRPALTDHAITFTVHLPERFALSVSRTRPYARDLLKEATSVGLRGPFLKVLGRTVDGVPLDRCGRSSPYFLFTNALTDASPVRCAGCFDAVPLYRLPPIVDGAEWGTEYADILRWQRDFRRFDSIWLDSGAGERFAFNQLSRIDSDLNQLGRAAAAALEKRSKHRVYCFIWQGNMQGDDLPDDRPCPGCGKKWYKPSALQTRIARKCDRCRLIAM